MRELQPVIPNLNQLKNTNNITPNTYEADRITFRQRFANSYVGKTAMSSLAAIGIMTGTVSPAVSAESDHVYTITNAEGGGVWLHSDPGLGDSGDLIKIMPDRSQFAADCLVYDTPVGPKRNPVWLHGKDETGAQGFMTDYYSSSKWKRSNTLEDQGLPVCGQQPKQTQTAEPQIQNHEANPPFTGQYDRDRAVSWALTNAEMQPPSDGSCTWFASNVLWQGGLPRPKSGHPKVS